MNAYEQNGQKRFDSGSVTVSYFPHIAPNSSPKLSIEEKVSDLQENLNKPLEIPLKIALTKGFEILSLIERCRGIKDKKKRSFFKTKNISAYTPCATFWTRDKDVKLEKKIKHYNALMVLDFDDVEDLDALKTDLKSLPWVYYAGLSVSGTGIFAVIPLDTDDFNMHRLFFDALEAEMKDLGYKVDASCKDVTRMRFVSYDPNPYFNEDCILYSLPEDFISDDDTQEPEDEPEIREITNNERLELYVQEWERKKIALDDYADWAAIGLSLSHEGEAGLAAFQRVSRFSEKYKPFETEMKFKSFESGNYSPGLGTFFYKCHQFGVVPESIPHYECIPFPVEVFPKPIQEIIRETNLHQNFPVDYIAPCLLFVACLACGNSVVVELQKGWQEKPLMYLAIVGGRGTNKTSCFEFALAPIRARDNEEFDNYVEAKNAYDLECSKPAKERKTMLEPPVFHQYILSDFTPEVLVHQHRANPRGLIVFNDELMGFILSFNKYRSGSDEQMWTQLFAGGGVTVNRVGADPVKINDTCIGVFGGIQPEILSQFAKGKIQSGFVDRWLFAFPEKVRYPKFNDVDIDEKIARNWKEIVDRILELPFDDTPRVVKLSAGAKAIFKEWFDKLAEQKNNGGTRFAGLATKMDRYCGRMALGIEIMKYGCKESELLDISEDSMRCSIALCYYFLACGLKAQKRFMNSPTEELTQIQREVYDELPQSFETKKGVEIAENLGMPPRTFKRWLNTSLFKKITYGFYEKKYR